MDKPHVNWDVILTLVNLFIEATGRPPEKTDFNRGDMFWVASLRAYRSLPPIGPIADILDISANEAFREIRRRSNYPCRKYEQRKRHREQDQPANNTDQPSSIAPFKKKSVPSSNLTAAQLTSAAILTSDQVQLQKSDLYAVRPLRPKSQPTPSRPIKLIRRKTSKSPL